MDDIKIKITSQEESKQVQEFLFEMGFKWRGHTEESSQSVIYKSENQDWVGIFCYESKITISGTSDLQYFTNHDNDELSAEEFIEKYTNQIVTEKQKYINFVTYCMDQVNDEKSLGDLYDEFISE